VVKNSNAATKGGRGYLSFREAAEFTAMSEVFWRKQVAMRRIACVRPGGRAVRIPLSAIEAFLAASTVPAVR
jgi:excisionase family DNA binding protein